jgi:uncharacterized protein (TIGR02246 family)
MFQFPRSLSVLVGAAAIAAVSCQSPEQVPSTSAAPGTAAEETAIRAEVAAGEAAINGRDFAAFAALFVPDGDVILGDGPQSAGPKAIRRTFETGWADAPADRQISITVVGVRFLSADIAVVDIAARFSVGEPAQDRAISVMVRRDGVWRIAALRVFSAAGQ